MSMISINIGRTVLILLACIVAAGASAQFEANYLPDDCVFDVGLRDVEAIGSFEILGTFDVGTVSATGEKTIFETETIGDSVIKICVGASSSGGVDDPFGTDDGTNAYFEGNFSFPAISGDQARGAQTIIEISVDAHVAHSNGAFVTQGSTSYDLRLVFEICGFEGYRKFRISETNSYFDPLRHYENGQLGDEIQGEFLTVGQYAITLDSNSEFVERWKLEVLNVVPADDSGFPEPPVCKGTLEDSTIVLEQSSLASDATDNLHREVFVSGTGAVPSNLWFPSDIQQGKNVIQGGDGMIVGDPDQIGFGATTKGTLANPFGSETYLLAEFLPGSRDVSDDIAAELIVTSSTDRSTDNDVSRYQVGVAFELQGFEGAVQFKESEPTNQGGVAYNLVPAPGTGGGLIAGNTLTSGRYLLEIEGPEDADFDSEWRLTLMNPLPPEPEPMPGVDEEPNDTQEDRNILLLPEGETDLFISGKLMPEEFPDCQPDTYLVLFDKQDSRVGFNDNDDCAGNGWGSGIQGATLANGMIIDNNDGSRSLRVGVTGRLDALDQVFNGLFMNAPHGHLGEWELAVTFYEGAGPPPAQVTIGGILMDNPVRYRDEFVTGAEAFRVNYTFGQEITSVDLCVDNTVGMVEVCNDVDFFEIEDLVPLCEYCIEQVGGLDEQCLPTDTLLGWFDKLGALIAKSETGGAAMEWPKLSAVADINGKITFAITGSDDCDFDGFDDESMEAPGRALSECPEVPVGHGVCGCYTLHVYPAEDHGDTDNGESGNEALMLDAMQHGDINMDGVTDQADLGILIGQFGWTAG